MKSNDDISEISIIMDTSSIYEEKENMQKDLFDPFSSELYIIDKSREENSSDQFFFRKISGSKRSMSIKEAEMLRLNTLAFLSKQNLIDKM